MDDKAVQDPIYTSGSSCKSIRERTMHIPTTLQRQHDINTYIIAFKLANFGKKLCDYLISLFLTILLSCVIYTGNNFAQAEIKVDLRIGEIIRELHAWWSDVA